METKVINEKQNNLFKRKEVLFEIESDSTPSYPDMENLASKKFSTLKENVKVKGIRGKFGSKKFAISIFIYDSEQDKNEIEPKIKIKKTK